MKYTAFEPTNDEAGLKFMESITSNVGEIQQEVLEDILTKNAKTEYLKGFLDGGSDKELFKKNVPVVEYKDIKHYIDRIANGEPSEILTAEPIAEFLRSSGTSSGELKWIPTTTQDPNRNSRVYNLNTYLLHKYTGFLNQGNWMHFRFVVPDITTPSALVVTNAGTSAFRRNPFANYHSNFHTGPNEIVLCEDTKQSLYCQLLCGLVQKDTVVRIGTVFASCLIRIIKFLEYHWEELCSNIRSGQISDWITDPNCRKTVSSILSQGMPDLADSIEVECKRESWEGIVKKLWPKTKLVEAIISGSMAQYIPKLEYYLGGLPLVSAVYAASEGLFGINLKPLSNPHNVSYNLIPWNAYYEFIPIDQNTEELGQVSHQNGASNQNCLIEKDNDHINCGIVDLTNVKIGQRYELLVTTFAGLYRYKTGDILEVAYFHNNAPQFKFVQRRNVSLSINEAQTTEEDLFKAITKAMQILEPLGHLLHDYSSYVDKSSIPGHYVFFWELQMRGNNNDVVPILDKVKMEECCNLVEGSLGNTYQILRRQSNGIGPLEIRVVKHGTFDALMDFCVSLGTSFSQYKTPRCIKSEKAIQLLNSMVVGSFSSKVLPS